MTQQTLPAGPPPAWPAPGDPARRPRILALDLSLRATGMAWTDHTGHIGVTTLRPDTKGHARLNGLLIDITRRAADSGAQLAVIEHLPVVEGREGAAIELAGLYWLVRHALWLRQIPYVLVHNSRLKMYALGVGSGPYASKAAVLTAMQRLYHPHQVYIRNTDEADAVAMLALALHAYSAPLADVPPANARAIKAIQWPALRSPVPGSETRAPLPGAGEARIP